MRLLILIGLVVSNVITGCAVNPKPQDEVGKYKSQQEPPPAPAAYVHTVRWPGESLSIIAKWYTGNPGNWKILSDTNPAVDRRAIRVGDTIAIPRNILKTEEPMPRSFVKIQIHTTNPKSKENQVSPGQGANPEEVNLDLYGPKD